VGPVLPQALVGVDVAYLHRGARAVRFRLHHGQRLLAQVAALAGEEQDTGGRISRGRSAGRAHGGDLIGGGRGTGGWRVVVAARRPRTRTGRPLEAGGPWSPRCGGGVR